MLLFRSIFITAVALVVAPCAAAPSPIPPWFYMMAESQAVSSAAPIPTSDSIPYVVDSASAAATPVVAASPAAVSPEAGDADLSPNSLVSEISNTPAATETPSSETTGSPVTAQLAQSNGATPMGALAGPSVLFGSAAAAIYFIL